MQKRQKLEEKDVGDHISLDRLHDDLICLIFRFLTFYELWCLKRVSKQGCFTNCVGKSCESWEELTISDKYFADVSGYARARHIDNETVIRKLSKLRRILISFNNVREQSLTLTARMSQELVKKHHRTINSIRLNTSDFHSAAYITRSLRTSRVSVLEVRAGASQSLNCHSFDFKDFLNLHTLILIPMRCIHDVPELSALVSKHVAHLPLLTHLQINACVHSVSSLNNFTKLKTLRLTASCPVIPDYSGISADFANLTSLRFSRYGRIQIRGVEEFARRTTNLRSFYHEVLYAPLPELRLFITYNLHTLEVLDIRHPNVFSELKSDGIVLPNLKKLVLNLLSHPVKMAESAQDIAAVAPNLRCLITRHIDVHDLIESLLLLHESRVDLVELWVYIKVDPPYAEYLKFLSQVDVFPNLAHVRIAPIPPVVLTTNIRCARKRCLIEVSSRLEFLLAAHAAEHGA